VLRPEANVFFLPLATVCVGERLRQGRQGRQTARHFACGGERGCKSTSSLSLKASAVVRREEEGRPRAEGGGSGEELGHRRGRGARWWSEQSRGPRHRPEAAAASPPSRRLPRCCRVDGCRGREGAVTWRSGGGKGAVGGGAAASRPPPRLPRWCHTLQLRAPTPPSRATCPVEEDEGRTTTARRCPCRSEAGSPLAQMMTRRSRGSRGLGASFSPADPDTAPSLPRGAAPSLPGVAPSSSSSPARLAWPKCESHHGDAGYRRGHVRRKRRRGSEGPRVPTTRRRRRSRGGAACPATPRRPPCSPHGTTWAQMRWGSEANAIVPPLLELVR
jgi:hypothetical protein